MCITYTAGRGRVLLFDLGERRPILELAMPAGASGYSDAAAVAIDDRFHIHVVDTHNHAVRSHSAFGRHLGDLGSGAARGAALDRPRAIASHGDLLYVCCGEGRLRRGVQVLRRDGALLRPLLPEGDTEGWFGAPRGIWVDALGILVADTLQGRVLRYRPDGGFLASVRMRTVADPAAPELLPAAVCRLHDGIILVALEDGSVRAFRADGERVQVPQPLAQLRDVVAFASDEKGALYVLDLHGERVVRWNREQGELLPVLAPEQALAETLMPGVANPGAGALAPESHLPLHLS